MGLAGWFVTLHPRYRRALASLTVLAVLAGLLVYAENAALEALTSALRRAVGPRGEAPPSTLWPERLGHVLLGEAAADPATLALLALGLFVALRLLRITGSAVQLLMLGALQTRSREDLEEAVLEHIQRRDDTFFAQKPPAEILNRLAIDIGRAVDRRVLVTRQIRSGWLLAGNLYFFAQQDAPLALVAALTSAAGAIGLSRMAAPLTSADREVLAHDDNLRARFEELLRATPEVQVGHLQARARGHLRRLQGARRAALDLYQRLGSRLDLAGGAANLLVLMALLAVVLWPISHHGSSHAAAKAIALVPVILKALPEIWSSASALVTQRLSMRLADTSVQRLLEYDAGPPETKRELDSHAQGTLGGEPGVLTFDSATYRYRTATGASQGGVIDVTTTLTPGRWVALIGGAGAGKSTLMQLLLGRIAPQAGTVRLGGRDVASIAEDERARLLSFMPQFPALLEGSIADNLTFGAEGDSQAVSPLTAEVLEASGLADICRGRALALLPTPEEAAGPLGEGVLRLRPWARAALSGLGLDVRPYETGGLDPKHWLLEHLLGGRVDRTQAMALLLAGNPGRRVRRLLRGASDTPLGKDLAERGRLVLARSHALLALPSYALFSRLTAHPVEEPVWRLRAEVADLVAREPLPADVLARLALVALTSVAAEAHASTKGLSKTAPGAPVDGLRSAEGGPLLSSLRAVLGTAFAAFDSAHINPTLTWRENLLFAAVEVPNSRVEQRVELQLLDLALTAGLGNALRDAGLRYQVGRGGARLSGGQRQLVALCRTLLLRTTPVVVLDEPTSALDPASRARVGRLLASWKKTRIVVTVTHDPELVRDADEARMLENGRLVAAGPLEERSARMAALEKTLRMK